ncbi:MAG: S8 family serine peptidase [Cyanothece sp. SIO2G6]|nr:S8 family serine peptidase [Cyanothece sp. SIO2G6]
MVTRPDDTLFAQQWYLDNQGQAGGTPGIDLNVLPVWEDYTGEGVAIAILDDGVERDHEDLAINYDSNPAGLASYSYAFDGAPIFVDDDHGTAVAGIIAAERNGIGVTGVAYESSITAFSTFNITEEDASSLLQQQFFDISNNSWGIDNPFESNFELAQNARAGQALETATRNGRNGLGTVFVWAAGNEFEAGASSNYGGYESSRFTIAVAAIDGDGIVAPYSVQGSNLLVSAFGDGDPRFGVDGSIVTTDRTGNQGYNSAGSDFTELDNRNYTGQFNGTSSATPMVSGIVALMLEANPRLGYRDVQEILAYAAIQTEPDDIDEDGLQNWAFNGADNWNGGGLHVNINYGFGRVDARTAVRLAETWTSQHNAANEQRVGGESAAATTIIDGATSTSQINIATDLEIDQVEIDIDLSHQSIEDLIITLVSPSGSRSRLFQGPDLTEVFLDFGAAPFTTFADDPSGFTNDQALIALGESYRQGLDFTFSTTFQWGESALGDWTLEIQDTATGTSGTLNSWSLSVYGDAPSADDTYFYSDNFGAMAQRDGSRDRTRLTDTTGLDRINAAMVTGGIFLNLQPGSTSQIAGQSLTMSPATVIEQAIGGDGADRLQGNGTGNLLDGGRGNDRLLGRDGADQLLGNSGNDRLIGGNDRDRLLGQDGRDRLRGGNDDDRLIGGGGNDRLFGGDGSDVLKAGPGNDQLWGQGGDSNRLIGNQGNDIFVLERRQGQSVIQDFQNGRDRLGLGRGVSLDRLRWSQVGNDIEIRVGANTLAILRNTQVAQLDSTDFTNI